MGLLKDLKEKFGRQSTEYVFDAERPSWQDNARRYVNGRNAVPLAQQISSSSLPYEDKLEAFGVLHIGIRDSEKLNYAERTRAFSEAIIESERAAMLAGNIDANEFYSYEREERKMCGERIAEQRRLRGG